MMDEQRPLFRSTVFVSILEAYERWLAVHALPLEQQRRNLEARISHSMSLPTKLVMNSRDFKLVLELLSVNTAPSDVTCFWGCPIVIDELCFLPEFNGD